MAKYAVTKDNYVTRDGVKQFGPFINRFNAELELWRIYTPDSASVGKFKIRLDTGNNYQILLHGRPIVVGTSNEIVNWLETVGRYIEAENVSYIYGDIRRRHTAAAETEINTLRSLEFVYHKGK
jgi:hypothetical protein